MLALRRLAPRGEETDPPRRTLPPPAARISMSAGNAATMRRRFGVNAITIVPTG